MHDLSREERSARSDKTTDGHGSTKDGGCDTSANNQSPECNVHHLSPVASPAAVDETVSVVCAGELLSLGDWDLEEVAERLPSFTHAVFEQVLLWYVCADLLVVVNVLLLAILLKVASEEDVPELCEICQ